MRQTFTMVEDFYDDFDEVRATALAAAYEPRTRGKYPGVNSLATHFLEAALPRLSSIAGAPLASRASCGSGCFRSTLASDEPELDIHFDNGQLSAVLFLNDAGQCAGRPGTSFFRHRRTGLSAAPADAAGRTSALAEILVPDSFDRGKWDLLLEVPMIPNRLIMFPSSLFHAPGERFGETRETGRLIQVFFLVRAPA